MALIIISVAWLLAVGWLISRALRQRRVVPQLPAVAGLETDRAPKLCVIVPARDESANIGACLRSLLRQLYPRDRLELIVVDDDSADGTAELVAAMAAWSPQIRLLRAAPLPEGWKGKVHACCTGVAAAPADAEWLCFLDADMRAAPGLMASAVAAAVQDRIDLLSLAPRHELGSFAERLILPCGFYLLAFSQDLGKVQAPEGHDVAATGQFMLLRRAAYEAAGGHAAVFAEICEDLELARLMKRQGRRVLLEDGSRVLSTRMYHGWDTLWPGMAKNLSELFGGPLRTAVIAAIAVGMAWAAVLVPLIDIDGCVNGSQNACIAAVPGVLASLAAFGLHVAGALHFGIPYWYGLLFPIGYTTGAAIAADSLRWKLLHRVQWKGRVYQ
jgi:chlorobactene glucosyltransferase